MTTSPHLPFSSTFICTHLFIPFSPSSSSSSLFQNQLYHTYPHFTPKNTQQHHHLSMAAENCVIGAMDTLWFHQTILFPEPTLFLLPQNHKKPEELSHYSSKNIASVAFTATQDDTGSQESDHDKEHRSPSSSPISPHKRSRNTPRLQKTMSCKTLHDLELEELKGFMDLGFSFRKENLSRRIVDLIPGLQRISDDDDEDEDEEEEEKGVMRPYLSEAWIIKRPDSPLLTWRMPRVSTAADMKKHLKHWARTVASAIQQDQS